MTEALDERSAAEQWRGRMKAIKTLRRANQHWAILGAARENLTLGVMTDSEMFDLALGDPSGREYWESWLSEAQTVQQIATLFSRHIPAPANVDVPQWAAVREREIAAVLTRALRLCELASISVGASAPVLKLRQVADWLAQHPVHRELVPPSLAALLRPSGDLVQPNPGAATEASDTPPPRRRRTSPKQDLVRPILGALYRAGVPLRHELTDGELVKAVGDVLRGRTPSKETILRAADRIK
jgi:hypothetical protein